MNHPLPFASLAGDDPWQLVRLVRDGVPVETVDQLVAEGWLSLAELDRLVVPRRTLAHRRSKGALTAEQSDRLVAVLDVLCAAAETFGARDKSDAWLRRQTALFDGVTPLSLLDTSAGRTMVRTALGKIAHGLAA